MSLSKHIKEHAQLGYDANPISAFGNNLFEADLSFKAMCLGASPPFNGTVETIGDTGSMIPHFYPFVFPMPTYFDLVNIGLSGNAANNADRIKIGFWNPDGTFLFERNLDFTAGLDDQYATLAHDADNTDVPAADRSPLLPRAFLVSIFPELQANSSSAATVSIACANTSTKDNTVGTPDNFAAGGEDPTAQAWHGPAGMVLNGATMVRPAAFYDIGTDWASISGTGINLLAWGSTFSNSAGNFPAIRVAGDFVKP